LDAALLLDLFPLLPALLGPLQEGVDLLAALPPIPFHRRDVGLGFLEALRETLHPLGEPLDQLVVHVERVELLQELLVRSANLFLLRLPLLLRETPDRPLLDLDELAVDRADPVLRLV